METDLDKGDLIKATIYSKNNFMNGKYKLAEIGLDDLSEIDSKDFFLLETLKMKADLADDIIEKAEEEGQNTTTPEVMKSLGEKINALGTPINKLKSFSQAIKISIKLAVYYGVSVGIWGITFNKDFIMFAVIGAVIGLVIGLLFITPVIIGQRTQEKMLDMSFAASKIWSIVGVVIGIVGLIIWIVKSIF